MVSMREEKGFTLIEVLIALAVFAIGILAANYMQLNSIRGNYQANMITGATHTGSARIEKLLALPYSHIDLDDDDGDGVLPGINYGLDDQECCPGGLDMDGNIVPGCTEIADGCAADENYSMYWNVAVNHAAPGSKTIKVIVVKKIGNAVVFDYIKAQDI